MMVDGAQMLGADGWRSMFTAGECLFTGGKSLPTDKTTVPFLTVHLSIRHPSPYSITP
jgi:hypothetical protein